MDKVSACQGLTVQRERPLCGHSQSRVSPAMVEENQVSLGELPTSA